MISQELAVTQGRGVPSGRGPAACGMFESMRGTLSVAVLVAVALAGCSTVADNFGDPWVQPGKFQFLRCEDIGKRLADVQSRERELHALMERSSGGAGGTAVNWFVYEPDLRNVEADLRALRVAAGEKRCSDDVVRAMPKADLPPVH
jgi:hypothetical protein